MAQSLQCPSHPNQGQVPSTVQPVEAVVTGTGFPRRLEPGVEEAEVTQDPLRARLKWEAGEG